MQRNRIVYIIITTIVIFVGLASRRYPSFFPNFFQPYFGDTLWALMVYLLIGLLFTRKSSLWIALAALVFSYSIEISQLYHAQWIDSIRSTLLGGLVLGFGFLWSDLICYTVGVGVGYLTEKIQIKPSKVPKSKPTR